MTSSAPQPSHDPGFHRVGAPPQAAAPVPQQKKKSKTLWIVLGVAGGVALLCCGLTAIVAAIGGDPAEQQPIAAEKPSQGASQPAQVKQEAPLVAKIGTPVRDGKFEFTVTGVKCGVAKVGDSFLDKKAQGQFCLVSMQVKNIGDEPRMFDAGNQKGFGAGDVKYGADETASLYANDNNESFLNEINPGNGITVDVVFDIPKDGRLIAVELHDSAFSGGIRVSLG